VNEPCGNKDAANNKSSGWKKPMNEFRTERRVCFLANYVGRGITNISRVFAKQYDATNYTFSEHAKVVLNLIRDGQQ
jgi:hypothetical protein